MQSLKFWLVLLLANVAASAIAQTPVTTSGGTTNLIPLFTGSSTVGNSLITQSMSALPGSSSAAIPTIFPAARLYISTQGSVFTLRGLTNTSWTYDIRNDQVSALTIQSEAPGSVPFAIDSLGHIGIGMTNPGAALEVNGTGIKLTSGSGGGITFQAGTQQTTAFIPANCGADYAESVGVSGDRTKYESGDILVIDPNAPGKFLKSNQPYSTLVAGIYSTKPGFVGRLTPADATTDKTEVPMAMVGRVPTKVSAENGPIKVGDLLVSSSTQGYAMKGTDRNLLTGAVIGKALGSLDSGTGTILVLVNVQ